MTQATRTIKVSPILKDYVERILKRRNIPYGFVFENDQYWCEVALSGNRFREVVERAFAERKSEADGVRYIMPYECRDKLLLKELTEKFGANGFVVLDTTQTY